MMISCKKCGAEPLATGDSAIALASIALERAVAIARRAEGGDKGDAFNTLLAAAETSLRLFDGECFNCRVSVYVTAEATPVAVSR